MKQSLKQDLNLQSSPPHADCQDLPTSAYMLLQCSGESSGDFKFANYAAEVWTRLFMQSALQSMNCSYHACVWERLACFLTCALSESWSDANR